MDFAGEAIGAVLEAHLEALAGELRGARHPDRLRETIDELMRVQAVVSPDAESAAGCLDRLAVDGAIIAPLRPIARELFLRHRERIDRIRAGELKRAGFVAARAAARHADDASASCASSASPKGQR